MSLQSRLGDLLIAIGSDIKKLAGQECIATPVGWQVRPPWNSVSNTALGASKTVMYPMDFGWGDQTFDAMGIFVNAVQSGGSTTLTLAVYRSDAMGLPDTAFGPLKSVQFTSATDFASTGNKWATFASPWVAKPGRYWLAAMYLVSTAPTTAATFSCLNSVTFAIPIPATTSIALSARALVRTGTTLPADASTPSNLTVTTAADVPVISLRRSA